MDYTYDTTLRVGGLDCDRPVDTFDACAPGWLGRRSLEEELVNELNCVFWACDSVANGALRLENLVVVPASEGLIAEEMNGVEVLDKSETICLVPTLWEYIETDLATNGIPER